MGSYITLVVGLALLSLCPQSSLSQNRIDPETQKKIDDYIQGTWLPNKDLGLILTVVRDNGELLYTTGYGMADIEKQIPNDNRTQFMIGSITKVRFHPSVIQKQKIAE